MDNVTNQEALVQTIEIVGGQSELARKLSNFSEKPLKQGHISTWLRENKKGVPPEFCLPIEQLTNGRIRACDLRPDIYPPELFDSVSMSAVVARASGTVVQKKGQGISGAGLAGEVRG